VTAHLLLERGLLTLVMLFCWLGVLGMWRMREPMQALHYLSLPACGATAVLTIVVFLESGSSQAGWKTLLICSLFFFSNSVVTHATARAFRSRDVGHWQALPGDDVEFVREERDK
jgi:multisubunit Na+/H+ antiporter MnhG subunit